VEGRKMSILVDSGANSQFMTEKLALELSLPLTEKKVGTDIRLANGVHLISRYSTTVLYSIGPFSEKESFHLLNLSAFDLVLGRPWLDKVKPGMD
jgi:hypothetical protein